MHQSLLRATIPCLTLLLAACSSDSASPKDASANGGATTGGGANATQGGNASNGSAGTRDSGRPGEGGATGVDSGRDSGTPPPACSAATAPDVGKLFLQEVVSVADELVMAAQPPGSTDWYLVRRRGTIEVFTGGAVRGTSFLDLTSEIGAQGAGGEQGLLGLTFHPDHESNGLFYVMISPISGASAGKDEVREYKRSANVFEAEKPAVRTIVAVPASSSNHNGGTVMFGPDKLLYVGTGDGGGSCNVNKEDAPQNVTSLYGKILRLDLTKAPPFASEGNPFVGQGSNDEERANASMVLHYGLRNPFRFGFDRATQDLYVADVGQFDWEEIDFAPKGSKGLNFGWADYEANSKLSCPAVPGFTDKELRAGSMHTPPIFSVDRQGNTTSPFKDYKSIIGGIVYRGTSIPRLQGAYFFGDYSDILMGALYQCGNSTSPPTAIRKTCLLAEPDKPCFEALGTTPKLGELFAIVEGNDGEMYIVGNRKTLYKVVPN